MSSKQLESILSNLPSATVECHPAEVSTLASKRITKLVATVPESLKEAIRSRALKEGKTEKIILLEALRAYGFAIEDRLLLDQRTLR